MPQPTIPKKVTILEYGDWEAVYFDDRLVHYHDALSGGRMLGLLKIEYDRRPLDPAAVDPQNLPDTLTEFNRRVEESDRAKKQAKRKRLRKELEQLDGELGGEGG